MFMTNTTLIKYKNEVENTIANIKTNRKNIGDFDLQKYIGTHFYVTGLLMPQLRSAYNKGYSFSTFSLEKQYAIYRYIFKHSETFDVLLQSLFFCEKYVKMAEPEFIFNELLDWQQRIDNWAHSDMLTQHFAYLHEYYPEMVYPHLIAWNKSENPWERRQSVLSLLGYVRFRKKYPPFAKIIALVKPLLRDNAYYVQKGVGWCMRETGIIYPEKTFVFLKDNHHLVSSTAFTTAVEKINEQNKEALKLLRKKSRKK